MFREIRFYDNYTAAAAAPQWLFLLLGLQFIVLGVLILVFPELLAYLVAGFFIFAGAIQLLIARHLSRLKKLYRLWRERFWTPESKSML